MVLFTIKSGISGTIQEQNEMGLDSIYRLFFVNGMEMYNMYDSICQALSEIAEDRIKCPNSGRRHFGFRGNSICRY